MDCSLLGSSVQGILQARILEWVAISFSNINTLRNPNHKLIQSFNKHIEHYNTRVVSRFLDASMNKLTTLSNGACILVEEDDKQAK